MPAYSFAEKLRRHCLHIKFTTVCRTGCNDNALRAWLRQHLPAGTYIPVNFRNVRTELGCSRPSGGARPPRRHDTIPIRVFNGRRKA